MTSRFIPIAWFFCSLCLFSCVGQKAGSQIQGSAESYGGGGRPGEKIEEAHKLLRLNSQEILPSQSNEGLCAPCTADNGSFACAVLKNPDPKLKLQAMALVRSISEKSEGYLNGDLDWKEDSFVRVTDREVLHGGVSVTAAVVDPPKASKYIEFNSNKVLSQRIDDLALVYYHELGHVYGELLDETSFQGDAAAYTGADVLNLAGACVVTYRAAPSCEVEYLGGGWDGVDFRISHSEGVRELSINGDSFTPGEESYTWSPLVIGPHSTEVIVTDADGRSGNCFVQHEVANPSAKIQPASASAPANYYNPPRVASLAFDGNPNTEWHFGDYAPVTMTIDLGKEVDLHKVKILPGAPSNGLGFFAHQVSVGTSLSSMQQVAVQSGAVIHRQWLDFPFTQRRARYIKIHCSDSPDSWVHWYEVEVYECTSERACN